MRPLRLQHSSSFSRTSHASRVELERRSSLETLRKQGRVSYTSRTANDSSNVASSGSSPPDPSDSTAPSCLLDEDEDDEDDVLQKRRGTLVMRSAPGARRAHVLDEMALAWSPKLEAMASRHATRRMVGGGRNARNAPCAKVLRRFLGGWGEGEGGEKGDGSQLALVLGTGVAQELDDAPGDTKRMPEAQATQKTTI